MKNAPLKIVSYVEVRKEATSKKTFYAQHLECGHVLVAWNRNETLVKRRRCLYCAEGCLYIGFSGEKGQVSAFPSDDGNVRIKVEEWGSEGGPQTVTIERDSATKLANSLHSIVMRLNFHG